MRWGREQPLSTPDSSAATEPDTQDAASLPVNCDNRPQVWCGGQLPIIGVAQLKPQPAIPHRFALGDLAAARSMRVDGRCTPVAAGLLGATIAR